MRTFFLFLLVSFLYSTPSVSAKSTEDLQRVLFLQVISPDSVIFELPIRHPSISLRDKVSIRFKGINCSDSESFSDTLADLESRIKRWVENHLKNSREIKIKRRGEEQFFEIIADGKNLRELVIQNICLSS